MARSAVLQPSAPARAVRLRRGHLVEQVAQRGEQGQQPGMAEHGVALDADGPQGPEAVRARGGVLQQRRLPDAGIALDDQHLRLAVGRRGHQVGEGRQLRVATTQIG